MRRDGPVPGTRTRVLGLAAAFTLALLRPGPAAAEETDVTEARSRFDRGIELFGRGEHEAALAEFLRAYEIAPSYAVLYNIGQVQAELRRYPAAVATFERYLSEGGARVPAERQAEVRAELERLRALVGRISVLVERPPSARVYVDDIEVGRTPLASAIPVSAGQHRVEVRAEGFLATRRQVTIAGGAEIEVRVSLDEAAAPGAIEVLSNVPGAAVTLDGREVGTTPLAEAISTSAGNHVVEATRRGYEPVRMEQDVASGEVARVELTLRPIATLPAELVGVIEVRPSERGASVTLDGQPLRSERVPIGPHVLELHRDGFEAWSRLVEVAAGQSARIEATLVPTGDYRRQYERRARAIRIGGYVAAGVAVAALGAALGLLVWNDGQWSAWESDRRDVVDAFADPETDQSDPELWARLQDVNDRATSLEMADAAGWAVLGIGAGVALAAVGLIALGPRPRRYARLSLVPGPAGIALAVAWETP